MARIRTDGYVKQVARGVWLEKLSDHRRVTIFEVRGQNSKHIRQVVVDCDGLWSCSCRGNRFRGMCYHVEIVKTNASRAALIKRLEKMRRSPAVLSAKEFDSYFMLDRFIAEPIHAWPILVTISDKVFVGNSLYKEWAHEGIDRYAGTILEGAWQTYGKSRKTFVVFDLLRSQGLDLTTFPLFQRLEKLQEILPKLRLPVELGEIAKDLPAKQDLLLRNGTVRLRDGAAPFSADGHSPRIILHKERKNKGDGQPVTFEEATIPTE